VQYDDVREGDSFIREASTLTPYDPDALRLALTLRHRDVEALEESLSEVRSIVGTCRRELESSLVELARTHAELARTGAELTRTGAELTQTGAELAQTGAELARTRAELARTRAELEARNGELARTVEARNAEIGGLRDALEQRGTEVECWRASVEDLVRRLDAFERSLSWRWTSPARAAYRVLRGR
jgi:septal ring factor EnvC (AmiA/AmiB activator)